MAGIYLHIPFCKKACHYCDFHFSTSMKHKDAMLCAISKELKLRSEELDGQLIETIYFGGGTPSVLTVTEIESLINDVRCNYNVTTSVEITLEANPDDLTHSKIKELAESPINRLSIGVQSFFEEDLKMMNRAHTAKESLDCLRFATQYFNNISIDLIYGIPNMTHQRWLQNLQRTFQLGIGHISSYALTIEENTALATFIANKSYPPVDENLALEHFNILVAEVAKEGFVHYETSNFAKPGAFSKHNTSYWKGISYVGVGPSAHSFDGKRRAWNIANNTKYIKSIAQNVLPIEEEVLSVSDRYNEYIMTGLRTIFGISMEKISEDFGVFYESYLLTNSQVFLDKELLEFKDGIIKTTSKGKFLADGIASDLFYIED
ncbi:MAG: radical SAM family heme chaperone HemW [Flavicella sp.]